MIRRVAVLLTLLVICLSLFAKDKKKDKGLLPKFIVDGRYVYVANEAGYDRVSVGTARDYNAERAVTDELRNWGRYTVVMSPDQADFIIALRVARNPAPDIGVGRRPTGGAAWPPTLSADIGPATDMMSVYSRTNGTNSAPFWRKTQKDGLSGKVPLLQAFRKDVEESAKKQAASSGP